MAAMTLEQLAQFCVPAALASAFGTSRLDAAQVCLEADPDALRRGGAVSMYHVAEYLGLSRDQPEHPNGRQPMTVAQTDAQWVEGHWRRTRTGRTWVEGHFRYGAVRYNWAAANQPTVAQWLRANPTREAILSAGSGGGEFHALHVRGGEIIEHNGTRNIRGRVRNVYYLDT